MPQYFISYNSHRYVGVTLILRVKKSRKDRNGPRGIFLLLHSGLPRRSPETPTTPHSPLIRKPGRNGRPTDNTEHISSPQHMPPWQLVNRSPLVPASLLYAPERWQPNTIGHTGAPPHGGAPVCPDGEQRCGCLGGITRPNPESPRQPFHHDFDAASHITVRPLAAITGIGSRPAGPPRPWNSLFSSSVFLTISRNF